MKNEGKLLGWLLHFVAPLKGRMLLAVLLGIISNLSVVAIPVIGFYQGWQLFNGRAVGVAATIWLLLALGILRGITRYGEQYCNHDIAFRLLALLRQQIFRQLRKLGPARLVSVKSGDFITTVTSDVEALEVFFAHTISPFFIFIGTTLVTVGFLGSHAWQLALILLTALCLVGLVIPLAGYHRYQAVAEQQHSSFTDLNQQVAESIQSLATIQQYDLGRERLASLSEEGQKLNEAHRKKLRQGTQLAVAGEAVMMTCAVLMILIGSVAALPAQVIGLGVVLSLSSFGPAFAMNGLGAALLTTFASGRRIYDLFQEEPQVVFPQEEELSEESRFTEAALQQLTFRYPDGEKPVLAAVDLSLRPGQTVGISGPSGIGKSTLIKLLMRYWDPESGNILLNQRSLRRFTESRLHRTEGFFEQTTFLFEDTVANNIRLGKAAATMEEIRQAAEKAAIHDWITGLPQGYETPIGGLARSLSDGERQRIGLARLFLQDAPLLLLDEPTSNLDYLNELAILETIRDFQDKAILLVSHRDTTLSSADAVYTLEDSHLRLR